MPKKYQFYVLKKANAGYNIHLFENVSDYKYFIWLGSV